VTVRPLVGWAAAPVVLWAGLVVTGLLASSWLCRTPLAMLAFFVLAVAAMARALTLAREEREHESEDLLGTVAVRVGLLFTVGIALTWAMVGLGPCL
jgi:hypothetical protein